jgi:hypothetical protein
MMRLFTDVSLMPKRKPGAGDYFAVPAASRVSKGKNITADLLLELMLTE